MELITSGILAIFGQAIIWAATRIGLGELYDEISMYNHTDGTFNDMKFLRRYALEYAEAYKKLLRLYLIMGIILGGAIEYRDIAVDPIVFGLVTTSIIFMAAMTIYNMSKCHSYWLDIHKETVRVMESKFPSEQNYKPMKSRFRNRRRV